MGEKVSRINVSGRALDIGLDDIMALVGRFGVPFRIQLDPKGGPEIMLLIIMLDSYEKRVFTRPESHEMLIAIDSKMK